MLKNCIDFLWLLSTFFSRKYQNQKSSAVPGTFTHLKWFLVPPDFRVLYKIFTKNVQILIKSTGCLQQNNYCHIKPEVYRSIYMYIFHFKYTLFFIYEHKTNVKQFWLDNKTLGTCWPTLALSLTNVYIYSCKPLVLYGSNYFAAVN
jgi:hypothetical protein